MRVLAISAHPDDETLGCGGTLLKLRDEGAGLHWLVATVAHEPEWSAETIRQKSDEVDAVANAYGMESTHRLGFPTVRLETVPQEDLMRKVRDVVAAVKPDTVFVVHRGDVHSDHRALYTATMGVLKPFYMAKFGVRRILSYETISSTDAAAPSHDAAFVPDTFSDITRYMEQKLAVMARFETEVQPDPMPRGPSAIRALARFRGATIGVEYAEAFQLVRQVL